MFSLPQATHTLIDFMNGCRSRELVICLTSGGGYVLSQASVEGITLYEKLTSLLEGARRSWILRTVIQSTVNKGQEGGW